MTNNQTVQPTIYLIYAGTIPFVLGAVFIAARLQTIPLMGNVAEIIAIYGLVIASFLAGIHWGQHLQIRSSTSTHLAVISNINAVLLWLFYLLLSINGFLMMLVASIITALVIDFKLMSINEISAKYFRARLIVTFIVVASLTVSGVYA